MSKVTRRPATREDLHSALHQALQDRRQDIISKSPPPPEADIFNNAWLAIKGINRSETTKLYAIPGLRSMVYGLTNDGRTAYRDGSHWYFVDDITTKLTYLTDTELVDLIYMLNRPNSWKWIT